MAGAVEQGFENENPEENDPPNKFVIIETPMVTLETIGMYQMPGMKVLDVITSSGMEQLSNMINLFLLSINDQEKLDSVLLLNFEELNSAVAQWVRKSMQYAPDSDMDLFEG